MVDDGDSLAYCARDGGRAAAGDVRAMPGGAEALHRKFAICSVPIC